MRAKRPYIVLSFGSTVAAMAWEKRCAEKTIPGRLIPLPRELSAGWRPCVADAAGGVGPVGAKTRPHRL